jgi:integrase
VAQLITHAITDKERGIYYAFPFLTGVRVSSGWAYCGRTLIWITTPSPYAEFRSATVQQLIIPGLNGEPYRVFPGPGIPQQWSMPRKGGGPILYSNFLKHYWKPAFIKFGVRYVTHHPARHPFVSVLQAHRVEVGQVAKLAGHANSAATLGHCTQAVRGGAEAIAVLDEVYRGTEAD